MGGGGGRERPINAVRLAQRMCWEADIFLPRTAILAARLTGTQMLLQSQVCSPNLRKPCHILLAHSTAIGTKRNDRLVANEETGFHGRTYLLARAWSDRQCI